jgi:hypothetical protein
VKTAGIDFSSYAVDLVTIDADTNHAEWRRYPLTGNDAFERTRNVRDAMPPRTAMIWDDILALAIEIPFGPNKGALAPILGAITACMPRALLVEPMSAPRWKKLVGLPGNCDKAAVRLSAVALGADQSWCASDPYDAYMLACSVRGLVERIATSSSSTSAAA